MKVNRTYSMDLRTLELLARKKNKSLIINRAVKQYLHDHAGFSLADIPTRNVLASLLEREDVPQYLIVLIKLHLTQ